MNVTQAQSRSHVTGVEAGGARSTSGVPAETSSLLPEPGQDLVLQGDLGAQLTAIILKTAHEQRGMAKVARESSDRAQEAAETREVDAMRSAAELRLLSGCISGLGTMASGTIGFFGAKAEGASLKRIEGSAKAVGGASDASAKVTDYFATRHDEAAKLAGQSASRHRRSGDEAREVERDAKQTVTRALDLYKQYLSAKGESLKAAILRA